jgi:hypothetical protein
MRCALKSGRWRSGRSIAYAATDVRADWPTARHDIDDRLRFRLAAIKVPRGVVVRVANADGPVLPHALWIGSIHSTCSGFSTGSMSRLTTTASLSLRTSTHSSGSLGLALISWWGTNGGT